MRLKKRIELLESKVEVLISLEAKRIKTEWEDSPVSMAEQRRLTLLKRNALITQGKDGA